MNCVCENFGGCEECGSRLLEEERESYYYAGQCPFGYGACFSGPLCDPENSNEAALFRQGSSGCAYTTPPR